MTGLETACTMTNPVAVRGLNATLFDMNCAGEGETSSDRMMPMSDRDGASVRVTDGQTFVSPRCTGFAPVSISPAMPWMPLK
ncbi:MAG: hypothetical protein Kow0013_24810 [Pararhodobacter sp.]